MAKVLAVLMLVVAVLLTPRGAGARELRLAAPGDLQESGFLRHLLPRFQLKHQIRVVEVEAGQPADVTLRADAGAGVPVFTDTQGRIYRLDLNADSDEALKFRDWLVSRPGIGALEGYPLGGPPLYRAYVAEEIPEAEIELPGDAQAGAGLALKHCGRCHVVDARNPMGGIGSTPSFGALRARGNWHALFTKFWTEPPHPSFTQVEGVTDAFTPRNPSHIVPVVLVGDEVAAIIAFIATIAPKDLGPPLTFSGPTGR